MKRELSISRAWEETKRRIAADGRLFVAVALALIALPSAIGQFFGAARDPASATADPGSALLMLVVTVIALVGQLALIRLALVPGVSVAEAISHGARRTPVYLAAAIIVLFGMLILAIPFLAILSAMGASLQSAPPPSALLVILLALALLLYIALRMMMTSPVASAERVGPIAIIMRSWQLTSGQGWRLLGFLLLFLLGAMIVLGAVSVVARLLATVVAGPPEPQTVSALIINLVEAIAGALATLLFIVMLARLYVQLSGEGAAEVSVPRSGT